MCQGSKTHPAGPCEPPQSSSQFFVTMQPDLRATSVQCHYDLQLLHAGAWNEEQLILHSLWKNGRTPVL